MSGIFACSVLNREKVVFLTVFHVYRLGIVKILKMKQSIDVITPCYNSAAFIVECVDSVRASVTLDSYTLNHIIVDDGSTDDTVATLQAIDYPHLKKISADKRSPCLSRSNFVATAPWLN